MVLARLKLTTAERATPPPNSVRAAAIHNRSGISTDRVGTDHAIPQISAAASPVTARGGTRRRSHVTRPIP